MTKSKEGKRFRHFQKRMTTKRKLISVLQACDLGLGVFLCYLVKERNDFENWMTVHCGVTMNEWLISRPAVLVESHVKETWRPCFWTDLQCWKKKFLHKFVILRKFCHWFLQSLLSKAIWSYRTIMNNM